jgi:hypothetical protein
MKKDTCINGCDLTGAEIPEEHRHYYEPETTHFSRMIGIDGGRLGIYDGVVAWVCPDCHVIWNRFDKTDVRRYELTEKFIRKAVENGDFEYPKDMDLTGTAGG